MRKILFVDDEEMILKGLRRMLHSYRDEWEVAFAHGGVSALEKMDETPFDVVVSDMRMPGMNGNALLAEVKKRHPSMVRIILSGHADQGLILESTRHAHQYLTKPCQEEELRAAIGRCCQLSNLLDDEGLVGVISGLTSLPSLPELYLEVATALEEESKGLHDVGNVIARDIGMTTKVLQLVNSAFFGLPRHIEDMGDAATFLGGATLKALVLTTKVFKDFEGRDLGSLFAESLSDRNLKTGFLAQRIAKDFGADKELCDHALLAGNLLDVGQLVMALNLPDKYTLIQTLVLEEGMSRMEAECQVIGSSHAQVGAYLLGLWGLPQPIVEAVAYHHQPSRCAAIGFTPLTAIHVADALVPVATGAKRVEESPSMLDRGYLERMGMAQHLDRWQELAEPIEEREAG